MTRVALKRLGDAVEDRRSVEDNPHRGLTAREYHLATELARLRALVKALELKLGERTPNAEGK